MFANILIASDGTDEADHVVSVAQLLARQRRARVVVAHVTEWRTLRGFLYLEYRDEDVRWLKVRSQVADLQAAGVDAEVRMDSTIHKPAPRLAQIARAARADLIVIGGSRHGTLAGLLFGSVVQRVPRLASCPVLVVPPRKRRPASPSGGANDSEQTLLRSFKRQAPTGEGDAARRDRTTRIQRLRRELHAYCGMG